MKHCARYKNNFKNNSDFYIIVKGMIPFRDLINQYPVMIRTVTNISAYFRSAPMFERFFINTIFFF